MFYKKIIQISYLFANMLNNTVFKLASNFSWDVLLKELTQIISMKKVLI